MREAHFPTEEARLMRAFLCSKFELAIFYTKPWFVGVKRFDSVKLVRVQFASPYSEGRSAIAVN